MRYTIPYKDATPARISQGFHSEHKGLDMISVITSFGQGVPLVAPEDVRIIAFSGDKFTPNTTEPLKKGFGVIMFGMESNTFHLFWHTGPVFPVRVGDYVDRGKIVATMSNSGNVFVAGQYVPISERYTNKGTHLHWENFGTYVNGKKGDFRDPSLYIDWDLKPTYTLAEQLTATTKQLLRISNLIST